MEEGVADAYRLMAKKQAANGKTIAGALSAWSTTPGYADKIAAMAGLNPNAPFDVTTADPKMVQRLMEAQFKMEGRRGSRSATGEQIGGGINLARGGDTPPVPGAPPVAVAQGAAPPAAPAVPAAPPVQIAQGAAPPAAMPPAAKPPNGAVDINITHKNPPPDAAVTAQGSGAVNVAPPRVEHQSFATI
jgi:hypothetical protein